MAAAEPPRAPRRGRARRGVRRSPQGARAGRRLPALRPEAVRAYAADVSERVLRALDHIDFDAPNPLLRKGFVFGLVLQHELQHHETMLQTLPLGATASTRCTRGAAGQHARRADEIMIEAGSFILGATDEPWAYDNELVPHEVEVRPSSSTVSRSRTRVRGVHGRRGLRVAEALERAGWEWRENEDVSAPHLLGARRPRLGARQVWQARARAAGGARAACVLVRGGGFRALGRQAAPDRGRVGASRRLGRAPREEPLPLGPRVHGLRGEPRPPPVPPRSRRLIRGRREPERLRPAHRRRLGVDGLALPALPGFLSFPYPEYSEVYFGEEYRVCAAARGRPTRCSRGAVPELGAPARRQIFAGFAARETLRAARSDWLVEALAETLGSAGLERRTQLLSYLRRPHGRARRTRGAATSCTSGVTRRSASLTISLGRSVAPRTVARAERLGDRWKSGLDGVVLAPERRTTSTVTTGPLVGGQHVDRQVVQQLPVDQQATLPSQRRHEAGYRHVGADSLHERASPDARSSCSRADRALTEKSKNTELFRTSCPRRSARACARPSASESVTRAAACSR